MDNSFKVNNFNLLRLLAASQVLIVHAFNHFEIHSIFIDAVKIFPGVPIFFFISGLLIGGTYIRNYEKGNKYFIKNRVLRLYPALIFCVTVSILIVFLLGYFKTVDFTWPHFLFWTFGQISFYQFYNPEFMRNFGIGVLNGSLWTIAVELQFYTLTPLIYFLTKQKKLFFFLILLFILSLCINIYLKLFLDWSKMSMKLLSVSFLPWVYMFLIGYAFNHYRKFVDKWSQKFNSYLIFTLYVGTMFFIGGYKNNAMNSINPISVFLLCLCIYKFSKKTLNLPLWAVSFINKNDFSYGLYIYHMPVINSLIFINIFSSSMNIILTIILTFLFSYFSWKYIESPALKYKKSYNS